MNRVPSKSAFTLIELILAITLMAAITVTAYVCLTTATRSWRVGVETADAVNHADYVMEQITMGLRSAYYPDAPKTDSEYGMQIVNDGDETEARDSLMWVKLGSALVGSDSEVANTPHKVVIYVIGPDEAEDPDLAPGGLVLKAWRMTALPADFDPDDEEFVKPKLLMPGVIGINFRIRSPKGNLEDGKLLGVEEDDGLEITDEEQWIDDDWTGDYTNRLPYAVETTLYFEPPSKDEEPIEVKRVTVIPSAELSWRDKGAAGGTKETGQSNNKKNNRNNSGNSNRNNGGSSGTRSSRTVTR